MKEFLRKVNRDKYIGLLALPGVLYLLIFNCIPMLGILISFQNFSFQTPLLQYEWVGLRWFTKFFSGVYFARSVSNTLILNALNMSLSMAISILLALLLNEFKIPLVKKITQSATYFPYFISSVVIVGILQRMFDTQTGIVNHFITKFGGQNIDFFNSNKWIRPLYIFSNIWSGVGWGSIIYMGAITAVDPTLYEAATIDGCDRLRQMRHITFPAIKPVIVTVLIMNIGKIMNVGQTRIILMYNATTYETMDVISTYVYRSGIMNGEYGYSTAVGLFNSVVNIILLLITNYISKKTSEIGLF